MEELDIREDRPLVDFGPIEDRSRDIIKVIGVGGGGCNAVRNMYNEGIESVTFAVCNTDSKSLASSPVPVKIPLGDTGLGAGANPSVGRKAAEDSIEQIRKLLNDGTKMVFVTAGMGGGTGTGAAPIIAGVAKSMGILTIGIVTIPFYFEKKNKIIKALRGVEEMRKNVDALLIINNERICDIYSDSQVTIKESFRRADQILSDATKSISELITVEGDINLDFCDVETTLRGGGGAIMAMGRARGEHRVEKAVIDALDSPLLYGNDIDKAKRILFNIYTSEEHPLFVSEMNEIDAFMDALDPNIDVIWGVSDDNTLGEDAKVTILATGFEDHLNFDQQLDNNIQQQAQYFESLIANLYKPYKKKVWNFERNEPEVVDAIKVETHELVDNIKEDIPFTVSVGEEEEVASTVEEPAIEEVSSNEEKMNVEEILNIDNTSDIPETEEGQENEPENVNQVEEKIEERKADEEIEKKVVEEVSQSPAISKKPFGFVQRAKKLMERISELTQDPDESN
ncbi:MAG: cell division protein FtsZ [Prevotella sp.]|nr:cell division protein FtsZ [Prevotella sp.]